MWKRTLPDPSVFIKREIKTVSAMISVYCRDNHSAGIKGLCPSCAELLVYAKSRLEKCPYGEKKPACSVCPRHCYQPKRREEIQKVMRYAGPRMMRSHPLLAIRHLVRKFRRPAEIK